MDSVIRIIPSISQNANGLNVEKNGAVIYLSQRVSKGLFAQLYILNDPLKRYPTISLSHSEPDTLIKNLNAQGANLGEFAYFGGFRGPVKIWKVDYPANTVLREEFLRTSGGYAEFDNLTFTK